MSDFSEAAFSYAPGYVGYPALAATRASTATYPSEATDQAMLYWPGQMHLTETATRASAATYTDENSSPWRIGT